MASRKALDETLPAGSELYVKFPGSSEWSARIILAHVDRLEYIVYSPPGDTLVEDYSLPQE